MLTDAHCHPLDLSLVFPEAEKERQNILSPRGEQGAAAALSACDAKEFAFNEELARLKLCARNAADVTDAADAAQAALVQCFAVHPQFFSVWNEDCGIRNVKSGMKNELNAVINEKLSLLEELAANKRINAVGEFGFDLYNEAFRETESRQDIIFKEHLETALRHDLPVVLHVRRAMHKIFAQIKQLSKCKAVIFHSWPGTLEEAVSVLRRGVNAYFSFGNIIMLNHRQAEKSCALLPSERLLTETDAPFQPRRAERFSSWKDLPLILGAAANLRSKAGNNITVNALEKQIENNFKNAFSI